MPRFLSIVSTVLELLGFALVVAAAALVDYRLGIFVAGVLLVVVGFVVDRPVRVVE